MNLRNKDFLKLLDFSTEEIKYLLKLSKEFKERKIHGEPHKFLEGKRNYLERAPFLIVSYSIDKKESGIFIWDKNFKDNRKFDVEKNHTVDFVDYGFTENNVQKDLKNRVFTV